MIGLLGGMSWESSAEYYRLLNELTRERAGGLHSAECLLWSVDFAEIEGYRERAKARPVCYAIVKVDNARGTRELFIGSLLSDFPGGLAQYDSANYWVPLWEKNRGGGNKELDGNDPVVKLRHPYHNMQFAPGMPRSR